MYVYFYIDSLLDRLKGVAEYSKWKSPYDRVVKFKKTTLSFSEFLSFVEQLQGAPENAKILLNLEDIHFAHPSGMAPIVANIRFLHDRGNVFDVVLPKESFLADYFRKAGWIQGIEGQNLQLRPGRPSDTFIPLLSYTSHTELNAIVNEALRHFSRITNFKKGVLEGLEWSVNEVADNVLIHAGGARGWIQFAQQPSKGLIEIVVADCGQGILSSLRQGHPELTTDVNALRKAVEKGVTRDTNIGQGNGLAGTLRIAIASGGHANIYSGSGLLRYMPRERTPTLNQNGLPKRSENLAENLITETRPFIQGTVVALTLPTNRELDIAHALWGNSPNSLFEDKYISETGNEIIFRVVKEASGFGNRPSAKPLRISVENLLTQFPKQRIKIDFSDVNLVSASFADEFIARLAKKVGILTFFERVSITNMNDLVRRTLDAVMEQRLKS